MHVYKNINQFHLFPLNGTNLGDFVLTEANINSAISYRNVTYVPLATNRIVLNSTPAGYVW